MHYIKGNRFLQDGKTVSRGHGRRRRKKKETPGHGRKYRKERNRGIPYENCGTIWEKANNKWTGAAKDGQISAFLTFLT